MLKKEYFKPDIIFESFSLSTSIAAGCELKTNTPSQGQCAYKFGGDIIFMQEMSACEEKENKEYLIYDKFCYHNPTDLNNLFNS